MTSQCKKRTTGPKNDAMKYIVDVDQQMLEHYRSPVTTLSEVRYLKQLRKGYVRTIEEPFDS